MIPANKGDFLQYAFDTLAQCYDSMAPFQEVRVDCLPPGHTALVVVDMINGFVKEGALASPNALAILPEIAELLRACKKIGIPAVFFADSHTMDSPEFSAYPVHCLTGTSESLPTCELDKVGGYTLINKNSTNGFLEPAFQQWLQEHSALDTFLVVGCCTDICVQQFALTLKTDFNRRNRPARVIVPMNLSATYDAPNHDSALVDFMSFYNMQTNGVEVSILKGVMEND